MKFFLLKLMSIPKTLYVNFVALPLKQAIHLPIFVYAPTKIRGLRKNSLSISASLPPFSVSLGGPGGTLGYSHRKSCIQIDNGKLNFFGRAAILAGMSIKISGGILNIGENFWCNNDLTVYCAKIITIQKDVLIGWSTTFIDDDGHSIFKNEYPDRMNEPAEIVVGNSVWIGEGCTILKKTAIPNGSIIGAKSLVTGKLPFPNAIYAGSPARLLKQGIRWSIK